MKKIDNRSNVGQFLSNSRAYCLLSPSISSESALPTSLLSSPCIAIMAALRGAHLDLHRLHQPECRLHRRGRSPSYLYVRRGLKYQGVPLLHVRWNPQNWRTLVPGGLEVLAALGALIMGSTSSKFNLMADYCKSNCARRNPACGSIRFIPAPPSILPFLR